MSSGPIIAVLLGTRPEAIKLAPVILACRAARLPIAVIGTGQHLELVDQALDLFGVELDQDLELMRPGQSIDHILAGTIRGVGELLDEYRPRGIVVQGDTTSTLGAALAAFHRGIPIAHVEAGLRSHDLGLPFPEEMNRRAVSIVTRWHFAPTRRAAENLAAEGIRDEVHVVGNTVVDALGHIDRSRRAADPVPSRISAFLGEAPFVLATAHRRESWQGGIEEVALAVRDVLEELPDHRALFVTHPNPVARAPVVAALADHPRALVSSSLPYGAFVALLGHCRLAVSDSGGVQEEAPTLGVPLLVTRARTERPEGVDAGAVRLVGTDRAAIRRHAISLLTDPDAHAAMATAGRSLYGDGRSGERIVRILADALLPG
jgi:UDP-N-acetylglucosamine 2-epimerase (non-hydrolysing)